MKADWIKGCVSDSFDAASNLKLILFWSHFDFDPTESNEGKIANTYLKDEHETAAPKIELNWETWNPGKMQLDLTLWNFHD